VVATGKFLSFLTLMIFLIVLLSLNAYNEDLPINQITEQLMNNEKTLSSDYIRYDDFSFNSKYFRELPLLILRAEAHSTNLEYLKNRVLQTTSDVFREAQGEAITKYSVTPINEILEETESTTILITEYLLPSSGNYFVGVSLKENAMQGVMLNITLVIEYQANAFDIWGVRNVIDLFYSNGFLNLWLSNPIMVGGTVILMIYLDVSMTRYSYKLSQQGYNTFFQHDIYELNVEAQEAIHENKPIKKKIKRKWFLLFLVSVFLSWILSPTHSWSSYPILLIIEFFFGIIFLMYFPVILNHIENIRIFKLIRDNPSLLSGQVQLSTSYLYRISRQTRVKFAVLWLVLFILFWEVFFLGGFLGTLLFRRVLKDWSNKTTSTKTTDLSSSPSSEEVQVIPKNHLGRDQSD
jgi:hypothetical protein